mmetsp:Transcript_1116/g.2264  ORF Transcript_1116/g.2264 Transcript_1116/m.2264 type:complete len:282 (-) Transcript_1116:99-944(-)|eukprot:CAMPEP_0197657812 /NCGR_PEP_ID=MMETSP1338-20131121/44859_1 /TAXON_ID=43686 ORGANISM="Pelagodinium beii, Strain RCC1491" /NCGR_SAMPLE_ID=MMETSP1338 /ASSEMBLY_ACC=CAM_ASM_000754 /LENGTH=281 /DNA_ID=CAMNT_0043234269 /DNA_START=17 /DNA_END=862 /DNA_ORIENTATION=-
MVTLLGDEVVKVPLDFKDEMGKKLASVVVQSEDGDVWVPPTDELGDDLAEFLRSSSTSIEPRSGTRISGGKKGIFVHENFEIRYFGLPRIDCSHTLLERFPEAVPQFRKTETTAEKILAAVNENFHEELRQSVLKSAFRAADEAGTGYLSRNELARLLRRVMYALTETDVNLIMKEADTTDDGKIEYHEFVSWMTKNATEEIKMKLQKSVYREDDVIRALFRAFDQDCNGVISRKEFQILLGKACPHFSKKQIDALLGLMDINHDGHIDYNEFVDFLFGYG